MDIHPHTFTTTIAAPDFWELFAERVGDGCVQMMPLGYGRGCEPLQTSSHIHVIHK